jgi:hypothetical protein
MPRVGFEPTISVFERAKTVHVLDRAATVFDINYRNILKNVGTVFEKFVFVCFGPLRSAPNFGA